MGLVASSKQAESSSVETAGNDTDNDGQSTNKTKGTNGKNVVEVYVDPEGAGMRSSPKFNRPDEKDGNRGIHL
jgi:hypothetical protein